MKTMAATSMTVGRHTAHSYRRLLFYLRPYRWQLIAAVLLMVAFGASDGVVPFLVKYVLDSVFARQDKSLLLVIPLLVVIFAVARAACDFGQQFIMGRIGHLIVRDLRNEVNRHLLRLSPDFYAFRSTADLVSRVTSDVLLVRTLLTEVVVAVLRDSIRVIALLVAAVYLDPLLALCAAVVFPIGIIPVYRFGKKMRRLSRAGQEAIGTLSAAMQESALGNRVVKIFGRESFEEQRFADENEKLTVTFVKSERVRALTGPVNEVLASLAIAALVLYGGYSVIGGLRSQGDFIAFLLAVFLLYDPFKKLSRVSSAVQQGLAGAERIFEILDTEPTIFDPPDPVRLGPGNDIEFVDVHFKYASRGTEKAAGNGNQQMVLSGVNLHILEGTKVAVVGFSGAGKSTLIDLIPRFIDPQRGAIKIGGVDISRVRLAELRSRIAMVGQHTFLFHDSILNNILYGNPAASREQAEDAARAAYAYDFISRMPAGFDTVIGEGGFTLSGGERQRIAIARAVLKNAPILILDEATTSLDSRSEQEVQSALEALAKGRTTIVVAHRLSTVRDADLIVVLKEGRVIEIGTHEELLRQEGEFSRLYALQFQEPVSMVSDRLN